MILARVRRQELEYAAIVAAKEGYGFVWSQVGLYETSGNALRKLQNRVKAAPPDFAKAMQQILSRAGQPLKLVPDNEPIRGRRGGYQWPGC